MLAAINAQLMEEKAKRQLTSEEVKKELAQEYEEQVKYYAKYDGFKIQLQDHDGNWPLPAKMFKFHKITSQDYLKAREMAKEELWRQYAEPPISVDDALADLDQVSQKEYIVELAGTIIQRTLDYYRLLASCYLHMTDTEFARCDWSKLRLVIDSCNYRTEHSLAEFSVPLLEFFMIENTRGAPLTTHLTPKDIEMLQMYQLWAGPSKIKPWDRNGGIVYEEDINTFLKIEEYRIAGERKKEKVKQARESRAGGGDGGVASGSVMGADGVLHKHATRVRNR